MRDKYTFVPEPNVPETHVEARYTVQLYFSQAKRASKSDAEKAATEQARSLETIAGGHLPSKEKKKEITATLTRYEQAHLRAGLSWAQFKDILLRRSAEISLDIGIEGDDQGEQAVFATVGGEKKRIGTIYHDGFRFEKIDPMPEGPPTDVYRRRGIGARSAPGASPAPRRPRPKDSPRHYIRLEDGTYLRRFVSRGLNQMDSENLSIRRPLTAFEQADEIQSGERSSGERPGRHDMSGREWDVESKLLSHTRGWAKRFISATTTERKVFSSKGEPFQSVFGYAVIDLARVPVQAIHDLHSPGRIMPIFRVAAERVSLPERDPLIQARDSDDAKERAFRHEQFLAARDVIRTREIVIHKSVPFVAVECESEGRRVVGLRHQAEGYQAAKRGGNEKEAKTLSNKASKEARKKEKSLKRSGRPTEVLGYEWRDGWWCFVECETPEGAQEMKRGLESEAAGSGEEVGEPEQKYAEEEKQAEPDIVVATELFEKFAARRPEGF